MKKISMGDGRACLTSREQECLRYIGQGFSYKEIGDILHMSGRTVETHLEHVKIKYVVYSRSQLLKLYHSGECKGMTSQHV